MTFYELENECKKRRSRVYIFSSIVFLFILGLVIFVYLYLSKNHNSKSQIKKQIKKPTIIKKVKKENKIEKNITIKPLKKSIKNDNVEILNPIIDLNIDVEKNNTKKTQKTDKIVEIKPKNSERKDVLSIQKLPSFETCIILAKSYYKNKDYQNALKWAKNANLQNREDKRSWIIVAKSLYKLNQKEKAIKILKTYYNYTKDKKVLEVLRRIQNDKI